MKLENLFCNLLRRNLPKSLVPNHLWKLIRSLVPASNSILTNLCINHTKNSVSIFLWDEIKTLFRHLLSRASWEQSGLVEGSCFLSSVLPCPSVCLCTFNLKSQAVHYHQYKVPLAQCTSQPHLTVTLESLAIKCSCYYLPGGNTCTSSPSVYLCVLPVHQTITFTYREYIGTSELFITCPILCINQEIPLYSTLLIHLFTC